MKALSFRTNYGTIQQHDAIGQLIGAIVKGDPIHDSVILTRKEVEEMLGEAWKAGRKYGIAATKEYHGGPENERPDKQQYLSSIIQKEG